MKVVFITLSNMLSSVNFEFLTIETLSSILTKHKIDNEMFFINYKNVNNILNDLIQVSWNSVNLVALCFTYENIDLLNYLTRFIKIQNSKIHITFLYEALPIIKANRKYVESSNISTNLIFAGEHINETIHMIFDEFPLLDSIVYGEADNTISELAERILCNGCLSECKGIAYRINDDIKINEARELVENLDVLPFANRDYLKEIGAKKACILTSRGCKGKCSFCAESRVYNISVTKNEWRGRSPQNIVDEIEYIVSEYNIKEFSILDNSFEDCRENVGYKRISDICDEILLRELDVFFTIHMRAETIVNMDGSLLEKMRRAGLLRICMGIESGYPPTLRLFNKLATVEDNLIAINKLRRFDINFYTGFIMFHPYTSKDELLTNLNFIKKADIGYLNIYNTELWLYINTPIYNKVKSDNLLCNYKNNLIGYRFKNKEVSNIFSLCKNYFEPKCLLQDSLLALLQDKIYKLKKRGSLCEFYIEIENYINSYKKNLGILQVSMFENILNDYNEIECNNIRNKILALNKITYKKIYYYFLEDERRSKGGIKDE